MLSVWVVEIRYIEGCAADACHARSDAHGLFTASAGSCTKLSPQSTSACTPHDSCAPHGIDTAVWARELSDTPALLFSIQFAMSGEKRAASVSFGSTQLVKRQKSDANINGSALVKSVSPSPSQNHRLVRRS